MSDYSSLFRDSGTRGTLDYIQARLKAGDLSGPEALALLGAVHNQLGQQAASDPTVYQAYSRVMESLRQSLPDVHEFVVSAWGAGRRSGSRKEAADNDLGEDIPEAPDDSSISGSVPPRQVVGGPGMQSLPEAEEQEEPEEGGESDDDDNEDGVGHKVDAEQIEAPGGSESDEDGNETDEDEGDKQEGQDESGSENELDDNDAMSEADEPEEQEQSDLDGEAESDLNEEESEDEEQQGDEKESSSDSQRDTDSGEGGEPESGQEESEWPEVEQPEAGEPFEGMDGAEDQAPGED